MSTLRGFGTTFDLTHGRTRAWYVGPDGIRRWHDDDEPVRDFSECPCLMCNGSGHHHATTSEQTP